MKRPLWGLAAIGLLTLTGCGGGAKASTHSLSGALILNDQPTEINGCVGTGGYSDIMAGTTVTIENQSGTIIATAALIQGRPTSNLTSCVYGFSAPSVPSETFYQVEVSHRGFVNYSKAQVVDDKWDVQLTLGSASD